MAVLVLRLSGPLQSWGDSSRFTRRMTRREPTKSGIVGMLASSLGRGREESVEDIAQLELAVRVDQRGEILRDFQTEVPAKGKPLPLSHRYYLCDAKFLVALGGPKNFLRVISESLPAPMWPLYLGRRSCPPDQPILFSFFEDRNDVRMVLRNLPWQANDSYKQKHAGELLEMVCDGRDGEMCESCADYPLSFSLSGRRYACRPVLRMRIENPDTPQNHLKNHDPMAYL